MVKFLFRPFYPGRKSTSYRSNRRLGGVQTNLFPLPGIEIMSAQPVRIQPIQYKPECRNLPALFGVSDFERKKHQCISTELMGKGKGKATPLQAWTGPEGSRRLRLPDFKTIHT